MNANIGVHSIRLISEVPGDGVTYIEKLQSNCANMTFSDMSRYDRIFHQVTNRGGGVSNEIYQDIPKLTGLVSFSSKYLLRGSTNAHISG